MSVPPNYNMWPHEKVLSELENRVIQSNSKTARRVTFLHKIETEEGVLSTLQKLLEIGTFENANKRRNSTYLCHGVHDYKGKFYPQIAKSLLNYLAQGKDNLKIMDPFGGSGTVQTESALMGFQFHGIELSPIASLISSCKNQLLRVNRDEYNKWREGFDFFLNQKEEAEWKSTFDSSIHDELEKWFSIPILNKISAIIQYIETLDGWEKTASRVLLSNIIRKVSHQDPRQDRIAKREELLKDAEVHDYLSKKLKALSKEMNNYFHALEIHDLDLGEVSFKEGDNRIEENWQKEIDIFLTSPPYGAALPYIDTYRLSNLILFGTVNRDCSRLERTLTGARDISKSEREALETSFRKNPNQIKSEAARESIFEMFRIHEPPENKDRRKNKAAITIRYFLDMQTVFELMTKFASKSSHAAFVLGNTTTNSAAGEKITIPCIQFTIDAMKEYGWSLSEQLSIAVTTEDKAHSKNAIKENDILIFKRS